MLRNCSVAANPRYKRQGIRLIPQRSFPTATGGPSCCFSQERISLALDSYVHPLSSSAHAQLSSACLALLEAFESNSLGLLYARFACPAMIDVESPASAIRTTPAVSV